MNAWSSVETWLQGLVLGCIAPAVALSLFPLGFAGAMGGAIRVPLVLALGMMQLGRAWPDAWAWTLLVQAGIGMFAGACLQMLYACVSAAGSLIDHAGGYSFSMDYAPVDGQASSPCQSLLVHLLTAGMFSGEGLRQLCSALLDASAAWPAVEPSAIPVQLRQLALETFPRALARGIAWAMPIVGVLLVIELGTGVMNRLMPQLNAFPLSLAGRALVVALALHAALPTLLHAVALLVLPLVPPP